MTNATTQAPETPITPDQLIEIGCNATDKFIIKRVSEMLTSNSKSKEMLTVYLQEEMEHNSRSFKTHLIPPTNNYETWRHAAASDHDHLSSIADLTLDKSSDRYEDYLYDIDTVKYMFGY